MERLKEAKKLESVNYFEANLETENVIKYSRFKTYLVGYVISFISFIGLLFRLKKEDVLLITT